MMHFQTHDVAKTILLATNDIFVFVLLMTGYLFFSRRLFTSTLFVIIFALFFNAYLKSIWQIPLPPGVGSHTWSFPSGHMHFSCALWGWLGLRYNWRFAMWAWVPLLCIAIGVSEVICGYHNVWDILGALVIVVLELSILNQLYLRSSLEQIKIIYMVLPLWGAFCMADLVGHQHYLWMLEGMALTFSTVLIHNTWPCDSNNCYYKWLFVMFCYGVFIVLQRYARSDLPLYYLQFGVFQILFLVFFQKLLSYPWLAQKPETLEEV
jgi:hypothetical protein